jgi:DNA-binding transcriptional LysR family regulator
VEARHLRYALALAEHQHFGRAAAAVGIAQPPLSKQIADLEREVGTRLFDRTPAGVFPTAAGEAFLARARRALTEMGAAATDAGRAARGEVGRLRIGFVGSALLELLPAVLGRFTHDHDNVRLEMHEMSSTRSAAALVEGEVDVSIGRGAPRGVGAETLLSVTAGRDNLIAVVGRSHPYCGQPSVRVDQLRQQPLIVAPSADEPATIAKVRALLEPSSDADASSANASADRLTEARDVHTIVGLAACGIGVGLGPACMRAIRRPDAWFCEVLPHCPLPDLVLSVRAADRSPVLAAFLDTCKPAIPLSAPLWTPSVERQAEPYFTGTDRRGSRYRS